MSYSECAEYTGFCWVFSLHYSFPVSAFNFLLRISTLERELQWAQLKIQVLEERLRQQRIQMLGLRSETLSNLQLELLTEEEPGVTADEVEAEAKIGRASCRERVLQVV